MKREKLILLISFLVIALFFVLSGANLSINKYDNLAAAKGVKNDHKRPVLTEVLSVSTPSTTKTPTYSFSTNKDGKIQYRGSCASLTKEAYKGENKISFEEMVVGLYTNCKLRVVDNFGNTSKWLKIKNFEIIEEINNNENNDSQDSTPTENLTTYPLHTGIVATVFWVGEPQGNGSSEDNALSAWDDAWESHYGGYDDYINRNGYYPVAFIPKENPFYLDLPYNDFTNNGTRRPNALEVIPWSKERDWNDDESLMKNRWVKIKRNDNICYGQIEDAGPYVYNDYNYVFGVNNERPQSTRANNAGMDVSPALRDCLKFNGLNNADNKVDWQFVDFVDVPDGPWRQIITSSQIYWP